MLRSSEAEICCLHRITKRQSKCNTSVLQQVDYRRVATKRRITHSNPATRGVVEGFIRFKIGVYVMVNTMNDYEERTEQFNEKIEEFENQFNVNTSPTGYEHTAEENGGIREEEFFVQGLIESDVDELNFKVGGWFSMDTRGEEPTFYCRLSVEVNGQVVGEDHDMIKCRYDNENDCWGQIRWGTI